MIESNNIKNRYVIALLIALSGTYLVGINKYLSPVYIIFIVSLLLFIFTIVYKKTRV